MAITPQDQANLVAGLEKDVATAEETARTGATRRGTSPEPAIQMKALRFKGRAVGEEELRRSKDSIGKALDELQTEAAFRDDAERNKFRSGMEKRLNQFRLYMMRKAGDVQKEIARKGVEAKKAAQMMDSLGNITANLTSSFIGGIGSKPAVTTKAGVQEVGESFAGSMASKLTGGLGED